METPDKHIPCVYFSAFDDGLIADVNHVLCRHLQYEKHELIGSKLEAIFTLSTRIFQQTHFYPLLQLKGYAEEIYITLKAKDGSQLPMLINAERVERDGRIQYYFAGISVSKRKKFEEEIIAAKKLAEKALNENVALKAAQKELQEHAERLDHQIGLTKLQNQELKQFNHLTTHTLQEPVRKIMFFSSQMIEPQPNTDPLSISLKIRKATEDIRQKLHGLQQYLWLTTQELKFETVDLLPLIEAAKKKVTDQNPSLSINLQMEPIPLIEGNAEQMQFLVNELLLNAVRFKKAGNTVNIKIHASTIMLNQFRELPEKYKYLEFLKLQFEDDGIGIDEAYQAQAFELFRVLHPQGGLGIGLPFCKKIIENHNGSLTLAGKENVSTTVVINLPLKQIEPLLSR